MTTGRFILRVFVANMVVLDLFLNGIEAQLQNVAVNKQTYQSTDFESFFPSSKAVDGNTYNWLSSSPSASCTHTISGERDPWWEVNLGDIYLVEQIVVYNRGDCCASRLTDVYFNVSNDRITYRKFNFYGGQVPSIQTIEPEGRPMAARWVKVYMISSEALTLCEVQVLAKYILQIVYYVREVPEDEISVNTFPVPLRATLLCIQECARPEDDFFMEFVDLDTDTPYIQCYCPI